MALAYPRLMVYLGWGRPATYLGGGLTGWLGEERAAW